MTVKRIPAMHNFQKLYSKAKHIKLARYILRNNFWYFKKFFCSWALKIILTFLNDTTIRYKRKDVLSTFFVVWHVTRHWTEFGLRTMNQFKLHLPRTSWLISYNTRYNKGSDLGASKQVKANQISYFSFFFEKYIRFLTWIFLIDSFLNQWISQWICQK